MANIAPQPSGPAEWQKYASSDAVASIPLQADDTVGSGGSNVAIHRGVFLDASETLEDGMHNLYIYADVLAFMNKDITISPAKNGIVQIISRVLTADQPVTLRVPPGDAATSAISIYAPVLDQPISVCTGDSKPCVLNLGPGTDNVGVVIVFDEGEVLLEYQKKYPDDNHAELQASLETELRIALAQFWKNSSIAISICSYVATITENQKSYQMLNTQAVALGQQLAGRVMAGKDMTYAPVLILDQYKETMEQALKAATGFQELYNHYQDRSQSLDVQIEAWRKMLDEAIANQTMQGNLCQSAYDKYHSATQTASSCGQQFTLDNGHLKLAQIDFESGVEKWKIEQKYQAIWQIFKAIITFAVNIAVMCIGDPAGVGQAGEAVKGAVEAAKEAEEIADQVAAEVTSGTLERLKEVVEALDKLYPSVSDMVDAIKDLGTDPTVDIPSIADITGTTQGDADSEAIVTMAAWDTWILESDKQMKFALDNDIEGAAEYQLALRKHAINGKQLAQAQAEAIKAGYEYVQAQMEVVRCNKQVTDLQSLLEEFEGQEDIYREAEAKLYDRLMALRTGVVIELQNMIWAYRYWALEDSKIIPDSTKPIEEYESDLYQITRDMETIDEQYPSDFQDFSYPDVSEDLPLNFGQMLVQGLKSETHTGSFTLSPEEALAGSFYGGNHYRLSGLDPTLRGALPNPSASKGADGMVIVQLQITTSGIYQDVQRGEILRFASLPQTRRCSYELKADGTRGETRDDPIFETKYHAEPTPFTQWKIKLLNPEDVDLSRLVGVDLHWKGHVRYDPQRRPGGRHEHS
ncbi:hypothetical protein A9Z42_0078310 [Trichoderma parareesei]|uniref:Uncharacterized protein n=1 Tax=Trichoderma parareesei TaxID=858221 RepID=A0A2H3A2W1_TRIPA|nr:hypothetical protein A9Z42_0078310 [Trichoderma parareesei]